MMSRPVHGNSVLQAIPGESPFCPGMVFDGARLWLPCKNCLDTHEMRGLQSGTPGQLEPIRFTEGAPSPRMWSIPAREVRRYSPVFPKRILIEEAIQRSLRYRSELVSFPVSREADRE
jgi:hypothetical protein